MRTICTGGTEVVGGFLVVAAPSLRFASCGGDDDMDSSDDSCLVMELNPPVKTSTLKVGWRRDQHMR